MTIVDAINIMSAISGGIAAYFWYESTKVKFPDKLHGVSVEPAVFINVDDLSKAINESARLNKKASAWSGISMLLIVFGIVASECLKFIQAS